MVHIRIFASLPLLMCSFLAGSPPSQAENLKLVVASSRLPAPSYFQTQAVYDGDDSVYIIGGFGKSGALDQITRYELSTGAVSVVGRFSQPVYSGAAFMDKDDVIRFGGIDARSLALSDIDRVSTIDGSSTRVSSLPVPAYGFHAAWDRQSGVAYLFGGAGPGGYLDSVLMYNASNDVLTQVGQLPEARAYAATAWDDEREMAYIFGGAGTSASREILTFDPATRTVTKLPAQLPYSMEFPNAVYAKEYGGRVIVFDAIVGGGLVSFDPTSSLVQQLAVDDWPHWLMEPASVYVPKLARIYILGGQGSYAGEDVRYRDEISYISLLDADEGSTTLEPPPTETTLDPTTEPEPEPETEAPSTPGPQPSTEPPTDAPSTEAPFCPPSGVHNFPYPGNCTLYIKCFDGVEQTLSCAPLLFDKIDLVCKPPSQTVCDEEIPISCPPEGYYPIPHQASCSKYYECIDGKAYESLCAPSTYFDTTPDVLRCNLAELALCNAECPWTGIAFLPIRVRDCKWYKVCVEGHSVNLECGRGQVYGPTEAKCVPDDAYACPYAIAAAPEDEAAEP